MIDPFVMDIIIEIVKAIVGVVIPAMTIYLAFYTRRFNERMERKALQDEVNRLTTFSSQARSFELMDLDSKIDAIVESVKMYTIKNNINIHDTEIRMMVESSFASLKALEMSGLKLYQLKQNIGEKK